MHCRASKRSATEPRTRLTSRCVPCSVHHHASRCAIRVRYPQVAEAGALSLLVQLTKTHAAASFAGQAAICVATGGRPELEAKALVAGADQDWLARAGLTV